MSELASLTRARREPGVGSEVTIAPILTGMLVNQMTMIMVQEDRTVERCGKHHPQMISGSGMTKDVENYDRSFVNFRSVLLPEASAMETAEQNK